MTTRDEATLALEALEATIRSQRAAMNKGSIAQILPALKVEPATVSTDGRHPDRVGGRDRGARRQVRPGSFGLTEGIYFADGRFKHPVDLVRATEKWSQAVAIVNEALAVAA